MAERLQSAGLRRALRSRTVRRGSAVREAVADRDLLAAEICEQISSIHQGFHGTAVTILEEAVLTILDIELTGIEHRRSSPTSSAWPHPPPQSPWSTR